MPPKLESAERWLIDTVDPILRPILRKAAGEQPADFAAFLMEELEKTGVPRPARPADGPTRSTTGGRTKRVQQQQQATPIKPKPLSALPPELQFDANILQGALSVGSPSKTGGTFEQDWGREKHEKKRRASTTYELKDHLTLQFPMYAVAISKLAQMDKMQSFEELMKKGDLVEWKPGMGLVFFLSHQWTAFNEPDHTGTQLRAIQGVFQHMHKKTFSTLFGTEQEWNHFCSKDAVGALNIFERITEDNLHEEVQNGYVWLDYSCVPQAAEAQEARLKAIESIPHYVDACTTFMALCPPVKHKELDYVCDYHTWRKRGWCRLEEQVSELKLFQFSDQPLPQFGPGATAWEVPRRPLMVLSPTHITCVDMFDHFYMLGVRSQTVMNGDFACCSLNHQKTFEDGTVLDLPCDKDRIRPFCRSMWQRKSNHFLGGSPMVRHLFAWRYISHMKLMMATSLEDSPENNDDPLLTDLGSIRRKYFMNEPEWKGMMQMMANFPIGLSQGMLAKHGDHGQLGPAEPIPGNPHGGYGVGVMTHAENVAEMGARAGRREFTHGRRGRAGAPPVMWWLWINLCKTAAAILLEDGQVQSPSLVTARYLSKVGWAQRLGEAHFY